MKKFFRFLLFSFLFSFFFIFPTLLFATSRGIRVTAKEGQSLYFYKDYYALIVGISNYEKWPKLPNAVNDAKEVAAKLKELGFEVKTVLDPTSREMKTVLNEMVYTMGGEENRAILFYYAGHGETETLADKTKMGYIIPRDCPLLDKNPMGFATHAISMRDIESASMRIKSKHVVMLFDSCFSGSLFALVRAVPHDITEKSTLPVRQYITAGREDEQVPDKSMFKRCFLIGLEGDADLTGDGYITGSELGMFLSDKVVNYTHRRQHPQYGKINNPDLDRGDFIFVPRRAQRKEMEPAPPPLPPKGVKKPQQDLDQFLAKIKEREKTQQKKKDALVENFKLLLQDLEKYKKIKSSKLDEKTKLAAWGVLARKYPEWSSGVAHSDSSTLVSRALADDSDGLLLAVLEKQNKKVSQHLASIPKVVTDAKIHKVKLRNKPKDLWQSDIEKMVEKHNFFVKDLNEDGDFPNDFMDNSDGTITDRATGLMWEKGGSSSTIHFWEAKKYVSRLNKDTFAGHNDWRIPSLEELCSLLEREINERGQYIGSFFRDTQSKCLSADRFGGGSHRDYCVPNKIVNFKKGRTDETATENVGSGYCQSLYYYIRAVRSIK